MRELCKQFLHVLLFFLFILSIQVYPDPYRQVIHFQSQASMRTSRDIHDFSRGEFCKRGFSSSYNQKSSFKGFTSTDFRDHCAERGYTEQEVLEQYRLYMFDEFVEFAQTYSGYRDAIKQLHEKLSKLNVLQKAYYMLNGTYCVGLEKRI